MRKKRTDWTGISVDQVEFERPTDIVDRVKRQASALARLAEGKTVKVRLGRDGPLMVIEPGAAAEAQVREAFFGDRPPEEPGREHLKWRAPMPPGLISSAR